MSCLDDGGYKPGEQIRAEAVKFAGNIRSAVAGVIAIDNANRLIDNYRMQRDISRRGMKIAEENQNRLKTVFWPREIAFLNEFGTPEDIEAAETLGRRYAGRLVSTVAGEFAKRLKESDCNASRYCTSARNKALQDLLLARAQSTANARILGRMLGFREVQARRDRNEERRKQAAALGQGLMGEAASLYQSAGMALAQAGSTLASSLNSALTAFGAAYRDPGRSQEQNQMLATSGYRPGQRNYQYESIDDFLVHNPNTAAQVVGNDAISLSESDPTSVWQGLQQERWNEADVGNRDLARVGTHTYRFTDSDGNRGQITVDMADFKLAYVDSKNPGDS